VHPIEETLTLNGIDIEKNPNNIEEIKIRCVSGLHEDKNPMRLES